MTSTDAPTAPDSPPAPDSPGVAAPISPAELLANRFWVRALARRLLSDDAGADDLVQRVWLAAMRRPPTERRTLRGWLSVVTRRTARDMVREDRRRRAREEAVARPEGTPSSARLAAEADTQRRLIESVLALPEPYREVVLMRYFDDLAPRDIAARLDVPGGTVRSRLARGLQMVRSDLEAQRGDLWRAALLPLAVRGLTEIGIYGGTASPATVAHTTTAQSSAASWLHLGGLIVKTHKKAAVLLLLLLGLGAAGLSLVNDWPVPAAEAETAATPPAAEPAQPAAQPRIVRERVRPAAAPAPLLEDEDVKAEEAAHEPAPAEPAPAKAAPRERTYTVQTPTGPRTIRASEITDGVRIGSGGVSAGAGMFGGWKRGPKFRSAPETGTGTFRGRVIDQNGVPLEGAVVHRIDVAKAGSITDVLSYEFLTKVATTAADGTFEATTQPNRAFGLVAEFEGLMNRRRGISTAGYLSADPEPDEVIDDLELRLPIDSASLGSIEGKVVDEQGRGLRGTQVIVGFKRVWTRPNGTFKLRAIPAGSTDLIVRKHAWKPIDETIDLAAGDAHELVIELEPIESGSLSLDGVVVDDEGTPLADIPVFMGTKGPFGARETRTDENGVFRIEKIADKYRTERVTLSTAFIPDRTGFFPKHVADVEIPQTGLRIVLQRVTELRLLMRAAESDEVLPAFNLTLTRVWMEDGEEQSHQFRMSSRYAEDGVETASVPVGRVRIVVEAPGRETTTVDLDVAAASEPREVLVKMAAADEPGEDAPGSEGESD